MTASTEPIIVARDVSRAFDGRLVVNRLSFDVAPGTILGIVGPSGSGKTTTVRMVRERLSGQMDLFRVAPVSSTELLVGKYVAYAVLSLAVSAIVGALQVGALGVPLLGSIGVVAGIEWMQYIAYGLPVTHGIATLQQLMLRGVVVDTWMLGILLGIGLLLYLISLLRLRRVIRTAD